MDVVLHRKYYRKSSRETAIVIGLLALIFLGYPGDTTAQEDGLKAAPHEEYMSTIARDLPVINEAIPENWHENSEKRRTKRQNEMTPSQYNSALKSTGMDQILVKSELAEGPEIPGWVSKGPFGNFNNTNGRVAGIQTLPNGSGYRLYIGAVQGGIWRSDSQSLGNWVNLGDNLPNLSARAFAVDPNYPQRIIVGTGDAGRANGAGMFVTTDEGGTWTPISLSVSPKYFYRLYFVPGLLNTLIAASDQGILRSIDGGKWTVEQTGHCTDLVIHPVDSSLMYACIKYSGVYKSEDWGDTWTQVDDPDFLTGSDWGRASIAICRDVPQVIAVVVETNASVRGVYRSTSGGNDNQWDDITGDLDGFGNQGWHAQAIAIRPNKPNQIYIGAVDIARTDDGGVSWRIGQSRTGIYNGHADITQLYFSPETGDNAIWICNDGGIYNYNINTGITVSVNGSGEHGLVISEVQHGFDADRNMRVGALQDNGIIRSVDTGDNWDSIAFLDGFDVEITDSEAFNFWYIDGIYGGPAQKIVWRRLFNGSNEMVNTDLGNLIGPLFYDRNDNIIYNHSYTAIVSRSQSGDVSVPWTEELTNLRENENYSIWKTMGSEVDPKKIFITYSSHPRDLSICRKNGTLWDVTHRKNIDPSANGIEWVWPSNQWADEFWISLNSAIGNPKILHTKDNGQTWDDVTGNLDSLQVVRAFVATPFNPLVLYAGTDIGVFRTTDGGQTWEPFMEGMPIVPCQNLRFVVDDGHTGNHKLVAATNGRGVWERTIQSPSILYVDKDYAGQFEDGTFEHPFKTIADAVDVAPSGSIIAVRGNTYVEPQTVAKNVTLVTFSGTTFIR